MSTYKSLAGGQHLWLPFIRNDNMTLYSEWGSCLHDSLRIPCESMSTLVFFIVPFLVAIVFWVLLCVIISVKAIKFLVLLIAFSLRWIVGCVYLFSPIPLASAIAFSIFLSLKFATVLLFFFGLVFSKMAREVLPKLLPNQGSTKFINKKLTSIGSS